MSSFGTDEIDIDLPPPPTLPSWLGSLCSQIDSYKDFTLPQVFTPKDITHGQQPSGRRPSTRTDEDRKMGRSLLSQIEQDGRFQSSCWTDSYGMAQRNCSDKFYRSSDCQSAVHQQETVCAPSTQPWPSLQPVAQRKCGDKCYRSSDCQSTVHQQETVYSPSTQPWPSLQPVAPRNCSDKFYRNSDCQNTVHQQETVFAPSPQPWPSLQPVAPRNCSDKFSRNSDCQNTVHQEETVFAPSTQPWPSLQPVVQTNCSDKFYRSSDCQSTVHQQETVCTPSTQPWPSLQPVAQRNCSDKFYRSSDCQSTVHQQETECAPSTQPWPSLQPVSQRQSSAIADFSENKGFVFSSQPWPSCDVKKPSPRQSCRITNSRLTQPFLTPALSSNQTQQSDMGKETFPIVFTSSQYQRPGLGALGFPALSSTSSQYRRPDLGAQRFPTAASTYSQYQQPDLGSDSPTDLFRNSPTYSPLGNDTGEARWDRSTPFGSHTHVGQSPVQLGHFTDDSSAKPVDIATANRENNNANRCSMSVNRRKVGGASKQDRGKESVAPEMRTLTNPYTPAVINFQGAGGTGLKLHSVEEIPKPYCDIFPFPFFNAVQSMAFDKLLYSDSSVVVSAPTGSGKTVLFELAIVRQLLCAHVPVKDIKVIYIGPMKSLCWERVDDWRRKLSSLGLECVELTGDSDISDFTSLHYVQVICTTPEKWDSVTRRWKDNRQLFQSICLVCIDEVHIVGDGQRGATVEAVITRMKMVHTLSAGSSAHPVRFVAVSATLPNTEDIGDWLSSHSSQAAVFKLGEEYRPVRLQRVVLGYPFPDGSSEFRFDLSLTYKLHSVIDNYSHGKPTLVFCSSRKSCQQTAETLVKHRWGQSSFVLPQFRQEIQTAASRIKDKKLSDLLIKGVGIHHAGLEVQDRKLVEELFRASKLAVLIATSTLSVGVNLPAHLVVVKATHLYIMGVAREYSDQQVLQMIGRAGRPQFDTSATAVIMTKAQLKAKYESLVNGTQVIESMLHKNLTEHVNVEVVLNTITGMADAASWLSHTLLHVRATKNPRHYGLPSGLTTQQVEQRLQDMCMTAIKKLYSLQLVTVDPETDMTSPTERGRLMARYCLEFQTIKNLVNIPSKSSIEHMLGVISSCSEFQDMQLRTSEKKTLNALNKNKTQETIRYSLKGKIMTKQMKVNCLVQAGLGCLPIHDYSLSQDLLKIFRVGQRITKCLMELQWLGQDYTTLLHAIQLCKSLKARLWPDSKQVARQLEGIGPYISQALLQAGLTSFQLLEAADPHHLELVVNRHPPFGNRVHDAVTHLPRYELVIQQEKNHQAAAADLGVSVSMLNAEDVRRLATCGGDHQLVFVIGDEDNTVIFKWKLSDRMLMSQLWQRRVHVRRALAGPILHIGLISLDWVGLDIHTDYQPFYTAIIHPHRHLREAQLSAEQTDSSAAHQTARMRAKPAAGCKQQKEGELRGSKQRNNSSAMAKVPKDNTIQQQLDVMHLKLQQFQHTAPASVQKLTHHTSSAGNAVIAAMQPRQKDFYGYMLQGTGIRSDPACPEVASVNQTISGWPEVKRPIACATDPLAAEISPLDPLLSSWEDQDRSPEVTFQTEPWRDLVDDFMAESDFDEPPCKNPKKSDQMTNNIGVPVPGNGISAEDSRALSSGNRGTLCPAVDTMGKGQPVSSANHDSHVHSAALQPLQAVTATSGFSGRDPNPAITCGNCLPAASTSAFNSWKKSNPAVTTNSYTRTNLNAFSTTIVSSPVNTSTCSTVSVNQTANMNKYFSMGANPVSTNACTKIVTQPAVTTRPQLNTKQIAPVSGSHTANSAMMCRVLQNLSAPLHTDQQQSISNLPQDMKTGGLKRHDMYLPGDALASRDTSLCPGGEKTALCESEQRSSKPEVQDRGLAGKGNMPSTTGFGWEHLQLYQSTRELMGNQDTQESSQGGLEEPWSQILEPEPYPTQMNEPAAEKPFRPVGITSPMVTGQMAQDDALHKTRYSMQNISTANLLQGIF